MSEADTPNPRDVVCYNDDDTCAAIMAAIIAGDAPNIRVSRLAGYRLLTFWGGGDEPPTSTS